MKETIFSLFEKQQEEEQKAKPAPVERMHGEEPAAEEPEAEKAEEKQEEGPEKEEEEKTDGVSQCTA